MHKVLGLVVAWLLLASCAPEPPPFRSVAGSRLLMLAVIDPAADVVWDAVKTVMTLEGTEEVRPQSEEQWLAVRNAAVVLAESGNLLMMEQRARDLAEWADWSLDLIDAGEAAMQAAEARNAEAVFETGGRIYEACAGCHRTYWPESVFDTGTPAPPDE